MVVIFWLWQLLLASAQAPPVPGHDADGAFTVALGVTCSHCHTPGDWLDERQPAFGVARRMMAMRAFLEAGPLSATSGVTCWSCHRGSRRPPRVPAQAWQAIKAARFAGPLATTPEDVQLAMAVYSASLGVDCSHCHVDGNWRASSKPAHQTSRDMGAMIDTLPKFLPPTARTQCFMCHQGQVRPATAPPK